MKSAKALNLRQDFYEKKQLMFLLSLLLIACHSANNELKQNGAPAKIQETYVNDELGWSIAIPAGFKSLSNHRLKINEEKGRKVVTGGDNVKGEADTLVHLVNFQKNQFNQFSATLQFYDRKESGPFEKSTTLTNKAIFDAYTRQKIKVDTASGKETIAGVPFYAFYIKIYGPNKQVIMNQMIYSTLLQGKDFSVNINYDNEIDKKAMLDAFKGSSF